MDNDIDEDQMMIDDQNKYTRITELNLVLADRNNRIEKLKDDVKKINKDIENEEKNKLDVTRTLQAELEERTETIIQVGKPLFFNEFCLFYFLKLLIKNYFSSFKFAFKRK